MRGDVAAHQGDWSKFDGTWSGDAINDAAAGLTLLALTGDATVAALVQSVATRLRRNKDVWKSLDRDPGGWNSNQRAQAAGGWGNAITDPKFLAATAVDVGLATIQTNSLQSVRGTQVAAVTGIRTTVFSNAEAFNTPAGRQIVVDNAMIVVGSAGVQHFRDLVLGG